jgi:hypothetical protein
MHKIVALTCALLMLSITSAPIASAQDAPRVTNVIVFDIGGNFAKFTEMSKRAQSISAKYGSTGKARIWMAAFAGPESDHVIVAIEYPNMVSMAQSMDKVNASPEWRQLVAESNTNHIKLISNSVVVELPQ